MNANSLNDSLAAATNEPKNFRDPRVSVAALLTCHNRREKTIACLGRLFAQDCLGPQSTGVREVHVEAFLVDDDSGDGTTEAVNERFPQVAVIHGPGDLFWAGGMRLAWRTALQTRDYNAFLMLNDDTMLSPTALRCLLETLAFMRQRHGREGIAVGSILDNTGQHHYGGKLLWNGRGEVMPGDIPKACDLFNCNATLVSFDAYETLGEFSEVFTHSMADYEYSARAHRFNVPVYIAAGYMGVCERNPVPEWLALDTPLRRRWQLIQLPKGLPPKEYWHLCRALYSWRWPIPFFGTYLRLMIPWLRRMEYTRHTDHGL